MRAPNYRNRKLSLTEAQTARMLYLEGWDIGLLSRHFDVSRQAIWQMLKRHGVRVRGRHEQLTRKVNVRKRDDAGVIVTLRRERDGELFSMHVPGKRIDALRHIADVLDDVGDVWTIACYSTPETIAGDLNGMRSGGDSPEASALSSIDRLDLLDPKLRQP